MLTPPPWYPILRGTTQQALFEVARAKGYDCDYRALRVADLFDSQGIWLVSSMTLAARVHTLDGRRLPRTPIAEVFAGWWTPLLSATGDTATSVVVSAGHTARRYPTNRDNRADRCGTSPPSASTRSST